MRHVPMIGFALVAFAALEGSLLGQAPYDPAIEQGIQPFQSYDGGNLDSVNLATGMLSLHIPVVSFPQRGTLHLDYSLVYDNPSANSVIPDRGPGYYTFNASGMVLTNSLFPSVNVNVSGCGTGCSVDSPALYEGNRTSHSMSFVSGSGTQARTIDGTGFVVNSPLQHNCTITDPGGITTAWGTNTVTVTDPNGNQITAASSSGCSTTQNTLFYYSSPFAVTDSMGRQIPNLSGGSWAVPGPNGGTATYQWNGSTLTLPDLTSYSFQYATLSLPLLHSQTTAQTFGVLKSITLPSGGTITYGYGLGATDPVGSSSPYTVAPITSRTVDAKDGTGPHTWTYSYAYSYNATSGLTTETTTVTDPLGNVSIHTFSPGTFYETQLQVQDNSSGSLKTVKTVQTSYGDICANLGNYPAYINLLPSKVTTIWPSGLQSSVTMTYDIDHSSGFFAGLYTNEPQGPIFSPNNCPTSYLSNPWTKVETDFGTGAPGGVLRTTNTNYLAFSNSTYFANNLLDLPSSVQVLNGSGSQVAYTTYGYDEVALQTSNITEQKVTGETHPGNLTSIHRQLTNGSAVSQSPCNVSVSSGGYLVTSNTYFDTGTLQKTVDPCLYSTSYLYSSDYFGAYPTTVTNSLNQKTTSAYDFNTRLITSSSDPNSATTTKSYDSMGRIASIVYPDGGSTSYCYTDLGGTGCTQVTSPPYSVVTTETVNPSVSKTSTNVFDGLGRVTTAQLNSDPAGTTTRATTYDPLGRVQSVSNPYRSTNDSTYGITSYLYDALNRKVSQCQPGGTTSTTCNPTAAGAIVQSWSYGDNTVTFADENGNKWQQTSDALGRLTKTLEPSAASQSPSMETDYAYDTLGNLTSIKQWGGANGSSGAITRSFTYDALSRLTCSSNPENSNSATPNAACPSTSPSTHLAGTTSYSYDANGNLVSKTDTRRSTVTYGYDALNRTVSKSYSDGTTPTSCYQYDSSSITNSVGRLTGEWTVPGSQSGGCSSAPLTKRTILAYDGVGRVLGEQQCTPNDSGAESCTSTSESQFSLSYVYDLAGNLTAYSNGVSNVPDVGSITFGSQFDEAGRLQNLSSSWDPTAGSSANSISLFTVPANGYTPAGAIQKSVLGKDIFIDKSYDNRLRVTAEAATHP